MSVKVKEPLKEKKKLSGLAIAGIVVASLLAILLTLYLLFAFSNIPFFAKWRTIYVETAMSTLSHKWLATAFIPAESIDKVMENAEKEKETQKDLESQYPTADVEGPPAPPPQEVQEILENPEKTNPVVETFAEEGGAFDRPTYTAFVKAHPEFQEDAEGLLELERLVFYEVYWELEQESFEKYLKDNPKLLKNGYFGIEFTDLDMKAGLKTTLNEPICVVDAPDNILIVEVSSDIYGSHTGSLYRGKLAVVKDSAQVTLLKSSKLWTKGELLKTMAKSAGAVLAINASGFDDPGWKGNGGYVTGSLSINGVEYGLPNSDKLFGLKKDNRLYIQNYKASSLSEYRWTVQFSPALVVDGKRYVQSSFGLGLQPRTAVGQSLKQEFMLLIIDGRQPTHSVGATVKDLANIMLAHNAYQAMNLDGGSSALMWYKGQEITKSSASTSAGRYLPDAIAVMPAGKS